MRMLFYCLLLGLHCLCAVCWAASPSQWQASYESPISLSAIQGAEQVLGLRFTAAERQLMQAELQQDRAKYRAIRQHHFANDDLSALQFQVQPQGFVMPQFQQPIRWRLPEYVELPEQREQFAFYDIASLASLLKNRQITSLALTQFFLARLKQFDPQLVAVITLTEKRALQQARQADAEIAAGHYRGPLHGIPYGVKDLLSVADYPTTWGAKPFADRVLPETATVVQKLDAAGAVLVAKLSVGALAWGDVWFGGKTRNPWNLSQGAGGSSAGSAAAVAAGLVPFAIGTETMGSIMIPAARCGVTGLRPSFGRVSRKGAMKLSWSLDKVGALCRNATDCALVFDAIRGDEQSAAETVNVPFNYDAQLDLSQLHIGYLKADFAQPSHSQRHDAESLAQFRRLGAKLTAVTLPETLPDAAFDIVVASEAATVFDEFSRSGLDDELVQQIQRAWPNYFRKARFIPAVEYLQVNRARYQLVQEMYALFQQFDVIIAPTKVGNQLLLSNLVGYPSVVIPTGLDAQGMPMSITLIGNLYDEATVLAVAHQFQQATRFDELQPPLFAPKQ